MQYSFKHLYIDPTNWEKSRQAIKRKFAIVFLRYANETMCFQIEFQLVVAIPIQTPFEPRFKCVF